MNKGTPQRFKEYGKKGIDAKERGNGRKERGKGGKMGRDRYYITNHEKEDGYEIEEFFYDESGMGTVEIILIIVVLIGLVIIFRNQLTTLVNNIFAKMTSESDVIIGDGVSQ